MDNKAYRQLEVWQRAMDAMEEIYKLTAHYPEEERYGLIAQSRRASVSITSNIAEGYGRVHRGDYVHHLSVSRGSLMELETQTIAAVRLNFVAREEAMRAWQLKQEVGRMLTGLINSLQK